MEAAGVFSVRQFNVTDLMIRPFQLALCLVLGLHVAPALAGAAGQAHDVCGKVAFSTLSSLCEAVMRIFPTSESRQPVATAPARPEAPRPLDLTLPPQLGMGDASSREAPKSLLPPLFDATPKSEGVTVSGTLITRKQDAEFEFDLSHMLDRIDGAEIHIRILQ